MYEHTNAFSDTIKHPVCSTLQHLYYNPQGNYTLVAGFCKTCGDFVSFTLGRGEIRNARRTYYGSDLIAVELIVREKDSECARAWKGD